MGGVGNACDGLSIVEVTHHELRCVDFFNCRVLNRPAARIASCSCDTTLEDATDDGAGLVGIIAGKRWWPWLLLAILLAELEGVCRRQSLLGGGS